MLSEHIASQIYRNFAFEPTSGQKNVVEALSGFMTDPDYSKIFILNGYAGTGKTTLISALVRTLSGMKIKTVLARSYRPGRQGGQPVCRAKSLYHP